MRKSWFVSAVLLILVMLLTSVASAQSVPRVIPANDNFANAKPIVIGKTYTVADIENATLEGGEPGALCVTSGMFYHTVWFRFSLPEPAKILLSTQGTNLVLPQTDSNDTIMAVYVGFSINTLTQVACSDDVSPSLFSELQFSALPDTVYYIMAGTYSGESYLPESVLKLTTRVINTTVQIYNGGFEQALSSHDWKVKNGSGDNRICANPIYFAESGSCAFRFVGNVGEASKLKQTLDHPGAFMPRKGGLYLFMMSYRVVDSQIGPAKIVTRLNYADGKPATKRTTNLTGRDVSGMYGTIVHNMYAASSKVASIGIEVVFGSDTGVLMVDSPILYYIASVSTRAGVLPLPPAGK